MIVDNYVAARKVRVPSKGEKQKKETHRRPAPFTSTLPDTLLIPLFGSQVGHLYTLELTSTSLITEPSPPGPYAPSQVEGGVLDTHCTDLARKKGAKCRLIGSCLKVHSVAALSSIFQAEAY